MKNDDLISRQAAIMHFVKASKNYECGMFDLKEVTHELWQLPSAQPERKKGKWEMKWQPFFHMEVPMCSACETFSAYKTDVCPHCGADMREEKTDED